jgi:hypothetical protein
VSFIRQTRRQIMFARVFRNSTFLFNKIMDHNWKRKVLNVFRSIRLPRFLPSFQNLINVGVTIYEEYFSLYSSKLLILIMILKLVCKCTVTASKSSFSVLSRKLSSCAKFLYPFLFCTIVFPVSSSRTK